MTPIWRPLSKRINLTYPEVKKCIESFIYGVNTPSRWGTQAPFSNITLDWTVPDDLAELPAIVGGKEMDFKYKDCKKEMDMINKAFIETMIEGDANGRGFQYPIPTYSITKDFDWSDTENNRLLFEMTSQIRNPVFFQLYQQRYGAQRCAQHVLPPAPGSAGAAQEDRRLLRLRREHRLRGRGYHQYAQDRLSVTEMKKNFTSSLDHMMDIAARSLKIKREVITKLLDEGLYPYTKRYLGTFDNHFSTIGLVGMNEAGLNARWLRKDMTRSARPRSLQKKC